MKRILITAGNHAKACFLSHLINNETNLVFGDTHHTGFKLPDENSVSYSHELLSLCLSNNISHIIPLKEKEIVALAEAKILFEEYEIQVLIPDLNQSKNLSNIMGNAFVPFLAVNNLEDFTKNLLEMGYPGQPVAIGSLNGKGNLIKIDDSCTEKINVWNLPLESSFIQINKLLKGNQFEGVKIYSLEEDSIFNIDVFRMGEIISIYQQIDDELRKLIENIFSTEDLQGFYEVALNGNQIVRIKNQVI